MDRSEYEAIEEAAYGHIPKFLRVLFPPVWVVERGHTTPVSDDDLVLDSSISAEDDDDIEMLFSEKKSLSKSLQKSLGRIANSIISRH